MPRDRLWIPGPVEVADEVLQAVASPVIGHRTPEMGALYRDAQEGLRFLLGEGRTHLLITASATGAWELASRNLVREGRRALHLTNGAFSERWAEVSSANGKDTEVYAVEWGRANRDLDRIKSSLDTGRFDLVALVHSETSTGVLNPVEAIAEVVAGYDDVLLAVDAVSSVTTVPLDPAAIGIDLLLFGVQKGLALPPGLSVVSVSDRAFARAEGVEGRGYYFDLLEARRYHDKGQTPSTPALPQICGLVAQLRRLRDEGLLPRFARHRRMAARAQGWAAERGFGLFAEEGYRTMGLTCVENTRGADVSGAAKAMRAEHHVVMDQGYGKVKLKTFRLPHMGETTEEDLDRLLGHLDGLLGR